MSTKYFKMVTASVHDFIDGIANEINNYNFPSRWRNQYDSLEDMQEQFGFDSDDSVDTIVEHRSQELFSSIRRYAQDYGNSLHIYRAITVNNVNAFLTALKAGKAVKGFDGIGIYWSWDEKAASAHWGGGGSHLLIEALTPMDAIDFKETALLSMDNEEECEVRLHHNENIEIIQVSAKGKILFDGHDDPITMNTGSGKLKSKGQMHSENAKNAKIKASKYIDEFNNWVPLTDEQIGQEYEWEYISHQKKKGFNPWPTLKAFKAAVKSGKVEVLTEEEDHKVGNRSRCSDLEELEDLTSGYRFPRDVKRIVKGYEENHPMPYPILLEQNGKRWVMSGNTRLDAAFIMGITPEVLVLKVPSFKAKVTSQYIIRLMEKPRKKMND